MKIYVYDESMKTKTNEKLIKELKGELLAVSGYAIFLSLALLLSLAVH